MNLIVNPIACAGHGVCAELVPELIELDEWGYPVIDPGEVPATLERQVKKAVASCPALALKLRKLTARRGQDVPLPPELCRAVPPGSPRTPGPARRACS
jgi:ferredoxin